MRARFFLAALFTGLTLSGSPAYAIVDWNEPTGYPPGCTCDGERGSGQLVMCTCTEDTNCWSAITGVLCQGPNGTVTDGGNPSPTPNVPEMSDMLALAFIGISGVLVYRLRKRKTQFPS